MRAPDAPAVVDKIPKAPPGPRRRTVSGGGKPGGGARESNSEFEKLHARDKTGTFTAGPDANRGPAPDEPKVGSKGPKVSGLQDLLNQLGYTDADGRPLKADGNMGPVTVAALVRAQRNLGVKGEDGYLGPKTRAALRAELGSVTVAEKPKGGSSGGSKKPAAKKPAAKPKADTGRATQADTDKTPSTRADSTQGVRDGKDTGDQADTYRDQGPGEGKYGTPWPKDWGKEPPQTNGDARRIRGYSDGSARYEDGTVYDPDTGKFRKFQGDDGTVRPSRRRTVSGTRSNSTSRGNTTRRRTKPASKEPSAEEALQALYDLYGVKGHQMSTATVTRHVGGLEHKALSGTGVKVLSEAEGIIEAIVAVTGIVDEVKDLIVPGAFTKTLATRLPKGVHSHDWDTPTSKALSCVELMPGDPGLPSTTARGEPWPREAGGVKVVAQFNLDTDDGRKAYSNAKFFDDEQEWSIGYHVPRGKARMDSKSGVRHIDEMELYEFSDVLFGAMPLAGTTGHKGLLQYEPETKAIPGSFEDLRDRLDRAVTTSLIPESADDSSEHYGWVSVRGTFPDHVVVCHYGKGGKEDEFDYPYTVDAAGDVTLGEPRPVEIIEVVVPNPEPPEPYQAPAPDETKDGEGSQYVSPSEILANESLRLYT